jgi:hypothetical protein
MRAAVAYTFHMATKTAAKTIEGLAISVYVSRSKSECTAIRDGLKRQGVFARVERSMPSGEYKVLTALKDAPRANVVLWGEDAEGLPVSREVAIGE